MKKRLIVLMFVVILGIPIGYFGRSAMEPEFDRVSEAIALSEKYCVPFAGGNLIAPEPPLVRLEKQGGDVWADPQTRFIVNISGRTCSVRDILDLMNVDERMAFQTAAIRIVEDEFPMLQVDTTHGVDTWDLFMNWDQYPRDDPRRWGISLYRFSESGGTSETALSVSFLSRQHSDRQLKELGAD
ncbi:hypothetical protein ACXYMO_12315 [Arenibacterium sp. CAU 1754]